MLGAADTFRAAAVEQLERWGERAGVDVVKGPRAPTPARWPSTRSRRPRARRRRRDRRHRRAPAHQGRPDGGADEDPARIAKQMPDAPHETLLTVDATTGQNGVRQAKLFGEAVDVTGIVLTKLDGTAKGGIALAIANELNIPIKLIGIGEQLEDLRPFDAGRLRPGAADGLMTSHRGRRDGGDRRRPSPPSRPQQRPRRAPWARGRTPPRADRRRAARRRARAARSPSRPGRARRLVSLAVKVHQTEGAAGWRRALTGPGDRCRRAPERGGARGHRRARTPKPGSCPPALWVPAEAVEPGRVVRRGEVAACIVPDGDDGRALARVARRARRSSSRRLRHRCVDGSPSTPWRG